MKLIYTLLKSSQLKKLTKYFPAPRRNYFFYFLITYFSIFFVTNNKIFLGIFLIFGLISFFVLKNSLFETAVLIFFISLPFENTIRQWLYYSPLLNRPNSFSFYFGITVKLITGTIILLLLCLRKYRYLLKIKDDKGIILILLFFAASAVTSIFFQQRLEFVFVGFVRLTISVWYYLIALIFFSEKNKRSIFKYLIISLIIFSSYIGLLQFTRQRPIGKYIELSPGFNKETGYLTTDGQQQYRVSSFISHPVYFGSFLSILIPIIIGYIFQINEKTNNYKLSRTFLIISLLVSVIVLLATLSRSTWINIVITAILAFIYIKKHRLKLKIIKLPHFIKVIGIPLLVLLILFPVIFILRVRMESIHELLTNKGGSAFVRLTLAKCGLEFAKLKPLTGIGLNNFSFEVASQPIYYFSAPPHNTFIIFLSELGVPTTIIFVLFILYYLYPYKNPIMYNPEKFGIWIGLLTFIISSQFHPLFNFDPTFDLFMFVLGYYAAIK